MRDPRITFVFDDHPGLYCPGDAISGEYLVEARDPQEVKAVEVSVLWYTMGKGDEDLAVHYFVRESIETGGIELHAPRRFSVVLPNSPLSYDGRLVKIVWCVRMHVFLRRGREVVDEQPFQLGAVPRPEFQEA